MQKQLKTPVLFLTFNRFENTKKVFAEIKKAKPKKLFIAADGPRNSEEKEKTDAVRKYILKNINWKCGVKTLFREKNLGCKYAVSGAIDWFFKNVEQGIILEDDCLPNQSFFRFCEELLERYKNNEKILTITGYNYLETSDLKESYYFSRYFECWGWATWKNKWKLYDIKMKNYNSKKSIFFNYLEKLLHNKKFRNNFENKTNSWALPMFYTHFYYDKFCITPKHSLIQNLGINPESTHTKEDKVDKKFFNNPQKELKFPLIHPAKINLNKKLTKKYLRKEFLRILLKKLKFINKK